MTGVHTNSLSGETSPYLLQHAGNPVAWQPWGPDALDRAKREDKPILLSIGYSACHWCHVMAHESFEDEATAAVVNDLFINIKVDREERPDLDRIYQTAHQLLAQRPGGWPLTMFLSPNDQTPFFGGTYFPKEPRHGLPGFIDLCRRVAAYFHDHRHDIDARNAAVRDAFVRLSHGAPVPGTQITASVLDRAREEIGSQFDPEFGGFGQAPKFPHPTTLERLLRHGSDHRDDAQALHMARYTLHAMASGGIYDQLGGGFCRYSVDDQWTIPHFEKMLYDNGQLLTLYTDAALIDGDSVLRRIAIETAEWAMREMQAPAGGYYAALDADTDGEEGKFYVWQPDDVRALLTEREYSVLAPFYGLDREPNFEGHAWHLRVCVPLTSIASQLGLEDQIAADLLAAGRRKLRAAREQRRPPGRDEKVLTAWNGLMIKGMARAGRMLNRPDFVRSAEQAFDFVRSNLWKDERLLAAGKDGRAHLNGYLDDYAFLLDGGLELLQARWRDGDLDFLVELAESLLDHFEDKTDGGFFFTSNDHEALIYRPKPSNDEALPSGNGVAAQVLTRLGHLLGASHFLDAAHRAVVAMWGNLVRAPSMGNALLTAAEELLYPVRTIVLRGPPSVMPDWIAIATRRYAPRQLVLAIPESADNLPGVLARRPATAEVTAYVCHGQHCEAPVTALSEFESLLATNRG